MQNNNLNTNWFEATVINEVYSAIANYSCRSGQQVVCRIQGDTVQWMAQHGKRNRFGCVELKDSKEFFRSIRSDATGAVLYAIDSDQLVLTKDWERLQDHRPKAKKVFINGVQHRITYQETYQNNFMIFQIAGTNKWYGRGFEIFIYTSDTKQGVKQQIDQYINDCADHGYGKASDYI